MAYAVATLVPVVWLGLLLSHTITEEADAAALRDGEAHAQSIAQVGIEPFLQGQPLSVGITGAERDAFTRTTGNLLQRGSVLVLRIRDVDGRVLFDAANPDAPPGRPIFEPAVQAAAAQGMVSALTHVDDEGFAAGPNSGLPVIETFVAVHSPANPSLVVGVVEISVPYEPIAAQRAQSLDRLRFAIVIGLGAVWLVLGIIVASVTRRVRRQSKRSEFMALHDTLTGLPNRALHADRVAAALASAGRLGTDVALVVVDLDRFKEVNDTLGHRNGDEFLRIVAARLTGALRPGDTVSRLGGDEFGIVLPGATPESVEGILRRLHEALGHEAELAGVAVSAEASMGYAMWPLDAETPETLLRRADLALFAAKTARSAIVRYHAGIDEFDPQRLSLIAELRRAITAGELILHYQPKVDATTGEVL
ncbi:MAG: diguanylate cyclase, partial [Actinomycetota bacterium]|nr:diguanylate cyclase [Actinomycetota bacterium]